MSKRTQRFCGIDVAKRRHAACILAADGTVVLRGLSFANDADGFKKLLERLAAAGGPKKVRVGMEATGHYWYALHERLCGHGYDVAVLNPIQTSLQARKAIRKRKTDRIDAGHIATLLKNGDDRPARVPGEFGMTCRQLSRVWYALIHQRSRVKLLIRSRLDPVWPEFETYFSDLFCVTGRRLLEVAPTPAEVLALDPADLTALLRTASRGRLGSALAEQIRQSARRSVGLRRGADGFAVVIRTLLHQLQSFEPIQSELGQHITAVADQLPSHLSTLPGASAVRIVSLYGETDPFASFSSPDKLVAFAGLDPDVFKTGQYDAPRRHISKRGSPYLRHTIWSMAHYSLRSEGDLRDYFLPSP